MRWECSSVEVSLLTLKGAGHEWPGAGEWCTPNGSRLCKLYKKYLTPASTYPASEVIWAIYLGTPP
ncbi:hypothetical protein H8D30_03340 [bacterium]|nr:hypothetical protein [bacterium]